MYDDEKDCGPTLLSAQTLFTLDLCEKTLATISNECGECGTGNPHSELATKEACVMLVGMARAAMGFAPTVADLLRRYAPNKQYFDEAWNNAIARERGR